MGIAVGSVLIVFGLTFLLGVIEHFFPDVSGNLIDTSAFGWVCVIGGSLIIVLGLPVVTSAPTVVCWNGQDGANRAACGAPAGVEGLQTVFPSMRSCRQASTRGRGGREGRDLRVQLRRIPDPVHTLGPRLRPLRLPQLHQPGPWCPVEAATSWPDGSGRPLRTARAKTSPTSGLPPTGTTPTRLSVEAISPAARQRGLAQVEVATEPHRAPVKGERNALQPQSSAAGDGRHRCAGQRNQASAGAQSSVPALSSTTRRICSISSKCSWSQISGGASWTTGSPRSSARQ